MKQAILFTRALSVLSLACLLASCAGGPKTYTESKNSGASGESYYKVLTFDSYGKPVFSEKLKKRPRRPGADFFLVQDRDSGRPAKYFHIEVKGGNPDMKRPFRTLYDRTVSGMKGGAMVAGDIIESGQGSGGDEAEAVLTFAALSIAVGTAGGITVGLVEGSYEAVVEAGKVLSSTEELLSFCTCDYDSMGRLRTLRAFEAGPPELEMFRIRYAYEGSFGTPSTITVEDIRQ